jgi:hypothetical protein
MSAAGEDNEARQRRAAAEGKLPEPAVLHAHRPFITTILGQPAATDGAAADESGRRRTALGGTACYLEAEEKARRHINALNKAFRDNAELRRWLATKLYSDACEMRQVVLFEREVGEAEIKAKQHLCALDKLFNDNRDLRPWLAEVLNTAGYEMQKVVDVELDELAADVDAALGGMPVDAQEPRERCEVIKLVVDIKQADSIDTP